MRNHKYLPAVAFVLAVAMGCSSSGSGDSATSADPDEGSTDSATVVDLSAVTEFDLAELEGVHIDPPATFAQSPSVGGDHYPFWQNCGFYTVFVIEGAATHSLEHGAVWITYNNAKLADGELAQLESLAAENSRLLITPYSHDEKLVLSSWGAQLRLDSEAVDDPQIAAFIEAYVDREGIPEPGVSCSGALGNPPEDARALSDGSTLEPRWS